MDYIDSQFQHNRQPIELILFSLKTVKNKWTLKDLNLGPADYESDALTN